MLVQQDFIPKPTPRGRNIVRFAKPDARRVPITSLVSRVSTDKRMIRRQNPVYARLSVVLSYIMTPAVDSLFV